MNAAVAQQRICGCGCGQDTKGHGQFVNGRHHDRWEASQTYPRYTSATERLNECRQHGQVYTQRVYQFTAGQVVSCGIWLGSCPQCERETGARLESLKPKPASACEARTCDCPAPKCRHCGQPKTMSSGSTGWHEWVCRCRTEPGCVEVEPSCGIIPPKVVFRGEYRPERQLTPWRSNAN